MRRPGSRFGARLEPYSFVDVQLYTGKSLDGISQAELVRSFADVRADWVRSACAQTMVEAVGRRRLLDPATFNRWLPRRTSNGQTRGETTHG